MGTSTRRSFSVAKKSPSRVKASIAEDILQTRVIRNPEVLSDLIIEVDGVKFALHKSSLSSKSRWMKKRINSYGEGEMIKMVLSDLPGGSDAFTLVAKFCYGIKFHIDASNVAMLLCAADYLEMTEEYGAESNLVALSEKVLKEVVLGDLKSSIQVLCSCQSLLPAAEDLKIVSRCIDAIAGILCRRSRKCSLDMHGFIKLGTSNTSLDQQLTAEWWADELLSLPIRFFQQVIQTVKSKGLQTITIAGSVMHYAIQFLKSLGSDLRDNDSVQLQEKDRLLHQHHHRIVLETIVNLLPSEKGLVSTGFLFRLLRASRLLDTTIACQMDLERRIGSELDQTTIEDLVVQSSAYANGTLFDVDFVHRLVVTFMQKNHCEDDDGGDGDLPSSPHLHINSDMSSSGPDIALRKVSKLVDAYLAEAAADPSLEASKFIRLSEAVPRYSRVDHDSIYRAIDIYLKAHPNISNMERKRICKVMDCQKLSHEACSHAAQNDRLPVHIIVQVLYLEQIRLHNALYNYGLDNQNQLYIMAEHGASDRMQSGTTSQVITPRESYASLRQENEELRHEVARMKSKLSDLEKGWVSNIKSDTDKTTKQRFLSASIIKTISRMNPFGKKCRGGSKLQESVVKSARTRRQSVS